MTKKFRDMTSDEKYADLQQRVHQFNMMELPGQPLGMHMGTNYLMNDLWRELERTKSDVPS